ncbi:MAG: LemA family protein [Oscillospiraceae bacterium]
MPYIIALAAVILISLIWWIATGNKFKQLLVKIDEASSGIDVALTKRYDTLAKLIDITKAYAKHEVETLEKIVNLRKGMTVSEKNDINAKLDNMQNKISVIAESYPELKSSENFKQLQVSVVDVEEHLQASRRLYNSNVSLLNQLIVTFPKSLVSKSMHLAKQDFFAAEEVKKADVAMKF